MTGLVVGTALHLLAAALGVAAGVPPLWKTGFFWDVQWWWVLLPEGVQPWAFAAARGAAYGWLAGWVAAKAVSARLERAPLSLSGNSPRSAGEQGRVSASTRRPGTAGMVTAVVALFISSWDQSAGLDYQLVLMALGAAVGHLTSLTWRGGRGAGGPVGTR